MTDTRTSPMTCPSCQTALDAATNVIEKDAAGPIAGDVTVCICCGHIMVFNADLTLRDPNGEEMFEIAGNPQILALQRARKAAFQ